MSTDVYRPGSFTAQLVKQSPLEDVRWDISQTNLALVASKEALEERGIRIEEGLHDVSRQLDNVGQGLARGFVRLRSGLAAIEGSLQDLSARFDWGLARIDASIGGVRDALEELLRLARTPEQAWAYEQFNIARDALGRGLLPEALEYVERAINGHQSHSGYKLEHRFHHILGDVRSISDTESAKTHDAGKARQAYLSASRYAGKEHKGDAAFALYKAAHLSFEAGDIGNAEQELRTALNYEDFPNGRYYLAKVLLHQNKVDDALPHFVTAIRADPENALKCFAEPECRAHEGLVRAAVMSERDAAVIRCRAAGKALSVLQAIVAAQHKFLHRTASKFPTPPDDAILARKLNNATVLAQRLATMPATVEFVDAMMAPSESYAVVRTLMETRHDFWRSIAGIVQTEIDAEIAYQGGRAAIESRFADKSNGEEYFKRRVMLDLELRTGRLLNSVYDELIIANNTFLSDLRKYLVEFPDLASAVNLN